MLYIHFLLHLVAVASCLNLFGFSGGQSELPNLIERDDKNQTSESSNTPKTTSSSISINPALPPGYVNLKTPASSSTTYVKSGDKVTFGWNYTSLSISPSAINVEVSCSQNSQVYTLARNQSIQTSSIVWDTNSVSEKGGLHLISAEYTLVIYDASGSPSDIPTAGKLAAFDYSFGVYIPQKYTPWPMGAKYMNISVRLGPPACISMVMAALCVFICYLI